MNSSFIKEWNTYVVFRLAWLITVYGKTFEGKTFAVVHKTHYLLENFRGASGPCHYVLYTANDSRGKLSRLAKKPRKFSPSKVLPYTVYLSASQRICIAAGVIILATHTLNQSLDAQRYCYCKSVF